jgi:ATP-dependent Clp protease ATP-binding subunit ClpB
LQVRTHFRPEFINRIDEFIIFDALGQEQIAQIVRLQVSTKPTQSACSLSFLPLSASQICFATFWQS